MWLSDCVSKDSSQTELLLVYPGAAYEAAKLGRNRMTQAALPIDRSFILEEEMADALDNDVCRSLIAALGVGVVLGGPYPSSERLFDITGLRYGKIILVTEQGELARHASREVIRFFYKYMRPFLDHGHIFVPETPLEPTITQCEFVEHILNPATRRLRIVGSVDELECPFDTPV